MCVLSQPFHLQALFIANAPIEIQEATAIMYSQVLMYVYIVYNQVLMCDISISEKKLCMVSNDKWMIHKIEYIELLTKAELGNLSA